MARDAKGSEFTGTPVLKTQCRDVCSIGTLYYKLSAQMCGAQGPLALQAQCRDVQSTGTPGTAGTVHRCVMHIPQKTEETGYSNIFGKESSCKTYMI